MKDLIEALNILWKYLINPDASFPTHCEHDILYVCGVDMNKVTIDDIHKLAKLGFIPGSDDDVDLEIEVDNDSIEGEGYFEINFEKIDQTTWDSVKDQLTDCFRSYRFGSC